MPEIHFGMDDPKEVVNRPEVQEFIKELQGDRYEFNNIRTPRYNWYYHPGIEFDLQKVTVAIFFVGCNRVTILYKKGSDYIKFTSMEIELLLSFKDWFKELKNEKRCNAF